MKFTIIAIIIALLVVIFALQNAQAVMVKLFLWDINGSMAFILLVTLLIGLVSGMLVLVPKIYRKNSSVKSQNKKIAELEKQLSEVTRNKQK